MAGVNIFLRPTTRGRLFKIWQFGEEKETEIPAVKIFSLYTLKLGGTVFKIWYFGRFFQTINKNKETKILKRRAARK